MNTASFLRAIWPSAGPYLLAIPVSWKDKETGELCKGFRHFTHTDVDRAAAHAMQLASDRDAPMDVFFALGSIKEDRPKKVRKADNIAAMRCFWLDIDVKAKADAYPTVVEAGNALRDFCISMSLPKPLVVSSGGGLHAYWVMTEDIDSDKWLHYATILKQLTKRWGLRADPSRTSDRASVLRPVGTFNWKTGEPREVRVVMDAKPVDVAHFLRVLSTQAEQRGVEPPAAQAPRITISGDVPAAMLQGQSPVSGDRASINDAAATGAVSAYVAANAKEVVTRCQQLKWQALNPKQVSEPQWYDMVGCLRHADKGDAAVQRMSRGHADYSEERTNDKITQHVEGGYGPTLCATFEDHNPGKCAGCPHLGKVKTPLGISRTLKPAVPATLTLIDSAGETAEVALPDPPAPFKRAVNPETGQARIVVRIDSDDGEYDEVIYDNDVYPYKLVFDERESRYRAMMRRWLPMDGWADFQIPTGILYDRRQLAALLGNIGVMPDIGRMELLGQYMVAYIRTLQKHAAAAVVYAQLGWRGRDKYVLPDCVVTAEGVTPVQPSTSVLNATMCGHYPPRGDLGVWKSIVAAYERPSMIGFQFGFGVGFASPLLHMTGLNGTIVSLVGSSGIGKSTALQCCNSIWGHPIHFGRIDLGTDTPKSVLAKFGVLNNNPATFDEMSNLDPAALSELAYTMSRGQGPQKLNQDGTMKENNGNWAMPLLGTTNKSLLGKLALFKDDASAEAARIFEYNLPAHTMTKRDADDNFSRLLSNYGIAAPVYVQYLIRNYDHVLARIAHWKHVVEAKGNVTSTERYWGALVACVVAGFEAANACGLTNADVDKLADFGVAEIVNMRCEVVDNTRSSTGALSEYCTRNNGATLVLNTNPDVGVPLIGREPHHGVRIRVEAWHRRMYIDRAHFRKFCSEASIDIAALEKELLASGVLLDKARRIVLGKGTQWGLVQTYAWVIDLDHLDLGNVFMSPVKAATG